MSRPSKELEDRRTKREVTKNTEGCGMVLECFGFLCGGSGGSSVCGIEGSLEVTGVQELPVSPWLV